MAGLQDAGSSTQGAARKSRACDFCRTKKIRCIGDAPCRGCIEHQLECIVTPRRRYQKRSREDLSSLTRQLAHFQQLLDAANKSNKDASARDGLCSPDTVGEQGDQVSQAQQASFGQLQRHEQQSPIETDQQSPQLIDETGFPRRPPGSVFEFGLWEHGNQQPASVSSSTPRPPVLIEPSEPPWQRGASPERVATGGYHAGKNDIEYWGPRTSMSICSVAGIAWVKEKVKQPDFQLSADRFNQDIVRRLKSRTPFTKGRKEDPPLPDALKFSRAYFEDTWEAGLGIVRRSCFESRLRSHYDRPSPDDDPSWYAMRNLIFAFGCRRILSRDATYNEAQRASVLYFENAMSVHSELLFLRTSIMGVQALTLMAYFAEGISCRMLQYVLVASAHRLACGQGLHVQPAPSWNLPAEEKSLRQCIFWAIYCLDKEIACRAGRPSMIDDEEINCQLPTSDRVDGSVNVMYVQVCVQLNHLSSVTRKMLFKTSEWRQPLEKIVNNVATLQLKLEELRASLNDRFQLAFPLNLAKPPTGLNLQQALALQFLHCNLVWDIHATLAHPWFRGVFRNNRHPQFQDDIDKSSAIVAETSRAALLDCRHVQIDASCLMSVAYYTPLYAVVNLFINVLRDPSLASSRSDLQLMDIACGYFARLEYATDAQWPVPLVKDTATIARNAVENFSARPPQVMHNQENAVTIDPELPISETTYETTINGIEDTEMWLHSNLHNDLNMEYWGVWQSTTDDNSHMDDSLFDTL